MINIAKLALKTLALKARAFEGSTRSPIGFQAKILLEYLDRNKKTEYGIKYNFSAIRSVEEYQRLVPVNDCETIRPYVERMANGEPNLLTADKVVSFGLTSGTTGKPKLIPITAYSRAKKSGLSDLWAYYIARDHPGILDGKILALISPEVEGYTQAHIPYGAETGHGYRNLPWFVKRLYAIPDEVFDIPDYDARYYCTLRIGMEHNITTLATLNPSAIILLCQKVEKWQDDIIDDIENGTLNKKLDIPEGIRARIGSRLKPNSKRAGELKTILKEKGKLLPKYFWPGLLLIECWKGGTVKLYLKELPEYFGDVPVRDFGCLSTEARSSIPMSDYGAGGVLAINTNFYEFIPKEDMGKPSKRFLLCDQLEKGKEYFMVVTTPGGLYRYNIDDIIIVDGFFNKTPMIEFVQKGLHAISITGEKLYESHVNEAVNTALDRNKLFLDFFSATIQWDKPPRYIFLVEFNNDPSNDEKKALLKSIEEELYKQNAEYLHIRRSQLLGSPILKVVRKGDFDRYRAKKISEGAQDGQFKVPELVQDPDFEKNFNIAEEIGLE